MRIYLASSASTHQIIGCYISLSPRQDVHMNMRHALSRDRSILHTDSECLPPIRLLHDAPHLPHSVPQIVPLLARQICQSPPYHAWNDEDVPRHNGLQVDDGCDAQTAKKGLRCHVERGEVQRR